MCTALYVYAMCVYVPQFYLMFSSLCVHSYVRTLMFLSEIYITIRERVYVAVILVGGSSWQPHWDGISALKIFWGKGTFP